MAPPSSWSKVDQVSTHERLEGAELILKSMFLDQREHIYANFGDTFLKYRRVVAEWMLDVCDYFNLHATTAHGAVAYLDRLQPNERFTRFHWQMLAICCILISSKYNECEEHVPDFRTLEDITQQRIRNEAVLAHELWALKKMGWRLNVRTPMTFLSAYALQGCFEGKVGHKDVDDGVSCVARSTVNALANLALLDTRFKGIPASIVASAIVYVTRIKLNIAPAWSSDLVMLTQHDESDFMETVALLREASAPLLRSSHYEDEEASDMISADSDTSDDTVPDTEAVVEEEGMNTPAKGVKTPREWNTSPTSIVDSEHHDANATMLGKLAILQVNPDETQAQARFA